MSKCWPEVVRMKDLMSKCLARGSEDETPDEEVFGLR